jgi:glycosyltransferase involved in cell wall biosynthesis
MSGNDRYAYIKNGDVVAQLQRITASSDIKITSGPDAFIYDYLSKIGDAPVFVVSRSSRNTIYSNKNIIARVYMANGNFIVKFLRRIFATIDLMIRLLLFRPTKILCGTAGSFLWAAYMVSRLYSIPIVFSCHNRVNTQCYGLLKKYAVRMNNWYIRRCYNVICHGPYLRDQLISIGVPSSKITEFDVGFADSYTGNTPSGSYIIPGVAEVHRIILFVGRIEKQKGVIDLLEACDEALAKLPDVYIVYIGKGAALEELQKAVERLKLKDKVRFLGYVNHERIVDIIKRSTLVVTPTRIEFPEGRCMSAMEGLIVGLPVVAPDFGPFPFLVQHDFNGLLYKPNTVSDLREKIMMLLEDPELYSRLKMGARITGNRLKNPVMTFGEAVCRAFSKK